MIWFFQFEVDIEEKGWKFTETLEVDTDKNTERVVVPTHNDVTGATFLHDFNLVNIGPFSLLL